MPLRVVHDTGAKVGIGNRVVPQLTTSSGVDALGVSDVSCCKNTVEAVFDDMCLRQTLSAWRAHL